MRVKSETSGNLRTRVIVLQTNPVWDLGREELLFWCWGVLFRYWAHCCDSFPHNFQSHSADVEPFASPGLSACERRNPVDAKPWLFRADSSTQTLHIGVVSQPMCCAVGYPEFARRSSNVRSSKVGGKKPGRPF